MMALFQAPSWAKQKSDTPKDEEEEKDLFSHKDNFMSIREEQIAAEKRRAERSKEKEQRCKEKAEAKQQRRSKKRTSEEADGDEGEFKKRRINAADSAKLLASAGLGKVIDLGSDDEDEAGPARETELPVRRSPRSQRTSSYRSPVKQKSKLDSAISFDANSDDDLQVTGSTTRPAPPPQEPEEDEDSDPEIAEMMRKAKANARKKETSDAANTSEGDTNGAPAQEEYDPPVQLFISSPIPNTEPLIVFRKLSQTLQPVRDAWVKKQGFDEAFGASIFLTHCGRRLYSSSTVKRLGLDVDRHGRIYSTDDSSREGVEKVAVVAVSPELFEQMKAEKVRKSKIAMGELEPEPEADEAAQEDAPPQSAPKRIRLVVKAKGKPEWKVQVTPTTRFAKILKAAKKNLQIPVEQDAYLEFDGDRLEPDDEVQNTEIEDMFTLELFVSN